MSLILDALNRSRDSVDPVPNLSTHHPVEPLPPGGRQYVPWVVLSLALALIAWLVWDRLSTPPPPPESVDSPVAELTRNIGSAATAVTTELKARAEEREGALRPATSQPSPGQVESVVGDVTAAGGIAAGSNPPGDIETPAVVEAAAPVPATADPAVARLYRDGSVPEEPADAGSGRDEAAEPAPAAPPEEQSLDIEEILRRAQDEAGNARLDEHPVPLLSSLSQQVKNGIPTIYYRRHDYASETGKSTVTLNGNTVKTGGNAGPGLTVEEILPDSVVLNYRGTRFRLRALNSWVNL